jgi:hypothetical protein
MTTMAKNNNNEAIDNDEHKVNKNKEPNMAKTASAKKNKAAATVPTKASAKTRGEDIIGIDTPPRKKQRTVDQAVVYFLTKALKRYMVNHYSKGLKNCIGMVFHNGGVPAKSAQPMISLDQGGNALQVVWKLSERLFTDKQATAQSIPKDSMQYTGYSDTLDRIHQAGVTPTNKYYQGAPQVIALDQECTGNPVTKC